MMGRLAADLQLALDPARLLRVWGFDPERWQEDLLRLRPGRALLCCCRQELPNHSRIISLPDRDETIRGFSNVALLVFDEAAWVTDDLYSAARPMLAVSGGRLLALSTPNGQTGWFFREWADGDGWHRTKITAAECPRISASFLAEERRTMAAAAFASEYECEFTDAVDSVFYYADIKAALDSDLSPLYRGGW
jgi:hypothetical protein